MRYHEINRVIPDPMLGNSLPRTVLRLIAVVVLLSSLFILGCDDDDDDGPVGMAPTSQDATTADLQNMSFTITDGATFDATLANQAVTLAFGLFDASNTAPFSLQSGGNTASGMATLQSPLNLDFDIVGGDLPFTPDSPLSLEATLTDGVLSLQNTQTTTTSTADGAGTDVSDTPPVVLQARLSSTQEVPPIETSGSGSATLALNAGQTEITYRLEYTDITDVLQAHLHVAASGANGGVVLFLCATDTTMPVALPDNVPTPPVCPEAGTALTGTLTADNFIPIEGVDTFAAAVTELLNGNTYVNVHTPANLSGELRGQVGAAELSTTLSGAEEVPPVTTNASGTAIVSLNDTQTEIAYTVNYADITDVLQAHIHVGAAGTNGGVVLFLCATDTTMPVALPDNVPMPPACPEAGTALTGTLTADNFIAIEGVDTFADAVDELLSGNAYVNVHTQVNLSGEIRGQIGRVIEIPEPPMPVSFANNILPIFTATDFGGGFTGGCASSGCHSAPDNMGGLNLEADQAFGNIVGVPSVQMPTLNRIEPGDSANSYLFRKHTGEGIAPGTSRMPIINQTFFDDNPDLLELERRWIDEGAMNN